LTHLLSDLLISSAPSRVVNVASNYAGGLDLTDINFEKRKYDPNDVYRQCKQADRMLSWSFAEKFKDKNVTVNSCMPGVINTNLLHDLGFGSGAKPSDGAKTPIWLATSSDLNGVTNKYFDNKKEQTCNFRKKTELQSLWELLIQLSKL